MSQRQWACRSNQPPQMRATVMVATSSHHRLYIGGNVLGYRRCVHTASCSSIVAVQLRVRLIALRLPTLPRFPQE